jgi:hypothetical protein
MGVVPIKSHLLELMGHHFNSEVGERKASTKALPSAGQLRIFKQKSHHVGVCGHAGVSTNLRGSRGDCNFNVHAAAHL